MFHLKRSSATHVLVIFNNGHSLPSFPLATHSTLQKGQSPIQSIQFDSRDSSLWALIEGKIMKINYQNLTNPFIERNITIACISFCSLLLFFSATEFLLFRHYWQIQTCS
jgi:hypothetical protein